jgi:hypothetical protein
MAKIPPMDLHLKIHNKVVREYIESIDTRLGPKNKQVEDMIVLGLDAARARREQVDLFERGKSELPSIDMYGRYKINGLDVATVYNQIGGISPEALNYIYYGALNIVGAIEQDKECRKVIPRLRHLSY